MILSFHPLFEADINISCADRELNASDLEAVKKAKAVILPQGCSKAFYDMARSNCPHVFPNYDAKFKYTGKIGQAKLFKETGVLHPKTETFLSVESFFDNYGKLNEQSFDYPFVFKFDWGGEGYNVHLIKSIEELRKNLDKAVICEKSGQQGFLIQEYIPSRKRALRVVVINRKIVTYWRVLKDEKGFCSNLSKGAVVDFDSDPDLQDKAAFSVREFCRLTKINLAGIDILFSSEAEIKRPLFLEINYFFGREGLGGSEKYYELLIPEIEAWINSL
jgi:ribosomal protein S6--L-glutamate ligase